MIVSRTSLALLVLVASVNVAMADALVVTRAMTATTIAEIYVEEGATTVELEIGLPDLEGFRNLMPDALYERMGYDPEPLDRRIARFFTEDLVIRADGGAPIHRPQTPIRCLPNCRMASNDCPTHLCRNPFADDNGQQDDEKDQANLRPSQGVK